MITSMSAIESRHCVALPSLTAALPSATEQTEMLGNRLTEENGAHRTVPTEDNGHGATVVTGDNGRRAGPGTGRDAPSGRIVPPSSLFK
jgi:hypothetical protein